jgi:hypothetical protein
MFFTGNRHPKQENNAKQQPSGRRDFASARNLRNNPERQLVAPEGVRLDAELPPSERDHAKAQSQESDRSSAVRS